MVELVMFTDITKRFQEEAKAMPGAIAITDHFTLEVIFDHNTPGQVTYEVSLTDIFRMLSIEGIDPGEEYAAIVQGLYSDDLD